MKNILTSIAAIALLSVSALAGDLVRNLLSLEEVHAIAT